MQSGSLRTLDTVGWQEAIMPDTGGAVIRFGYMMASQDQLTRSPQAIFVAQPPNTTIPRHFHDNAQFQIFIDGAARLASHDVQPVGIHYAAHQTVYGPIVSGPEGVVYLTLRLNTEDGAFWWPVDRDHMSRTTPRVQLTKQGTSPNEARLSELHDVEVETVIPGDEKGLAAWILRVPAGVQVDLPIHAGGAGRFVVVSAGSVVTTDEVGERYFTLWYDGNEPAEDLVAGDGGLELVITQFPASALN